MKQFVKKALLPLAVFVVAVVSAFAMNTPSTSAAPEQFQPLYTGPICYTHPTTSVCTSISLNHIDLNCTLVVTGVTCTFNVPLIGNQIMRSCVQDQMNPSTWICIQGLYKRTVLRAS